MNKRSVDFVSQAQNGKHLRRHGDLLGSVNIINMVRSHLWLSACSWLHYNGSGWVGGCFIYKNEKNIVFRIIHLTLGNGRERRGRVTADKSGLLCSQPWHQSTLIGPFCESDVVFYPIRQTPRHPSRCGTSKKANKAFSKRDDKETSVCEAPLLRTV